MKRLVAGLIRRAHHGAAGIRPEDRHVRLSGHDESVPVGAADAGDREDDRLQDQLASVRRRRRRDPCDGIGRRPAGRGRVGADRDRREPGARRRAFLDPRGHRGGRGAGGAQRQRHREGGRPQGQEDRDAVRVDLAFSPDVRARARGAQARRPAGAQHASARDRGGVGPRRHRRGVHLGPGARHRQEERQGAGHLRRALQEGQVHVRRAHRRRRNSRARIPSSWWRW